MNGSLSGGSYIFVSFFLQNDYCFYFFSFFKLGIKRATSVLADARMLVITREQPSSTKRGSIRQIMNHFIQIHIPWLTALRLACCV